ncbi:MAG: hypothetical protein KJ993_04180 [Actinobacteria bacterium]|nr:hypothetical protein [Actinomycetota bacterium]
MTEMMGRKTRKWVIVCALAILVLAGSGIAAFLLLRNGGNEPPPFERKIKPAKEFVLPPLPEPKLGLDIPAGQENRSVIGDFQFRIDPSDYPVVPETLNVYEYVRAIETEEQFRSMAAKFGVQGIMEKSGNFYVIHDGDKKFRYWFTEERVMYSDEEVQRRPTEKPDIPSQEQCRTIAWNLMEKMGLLPPEAEIIGEATDGGSLRAKGLDDVIFERSVEIGRRLDGYPIRGPGMEMWVSLGDKGELASFDSSIRPLKLFGTYKVKSVEEALEDARKGNGTMNLDPDIPNPTVNKISIMYYADPSDPENRLLQPVYSIVGQCCIYVPATKD